METFSLLRIAMRDLQYDRDHPMSLAHSTGDRHGEAKRARAAKQEGRSV